jgi:hypothetical protein
MPFSNLMYYHHHWKMQDCDDYCYSRRWKFSPVVLKEEGEEAIPVRK